MSKILSGQAYLYRKEGLPNTVIEVEMHDPVRGDLLNRALNEKTSPHFSYLCQKFVEKNGSFYLQPNNHSLIAVKTKKYRELGSMSVGYHLIDITYFKNSIRISWHHALADGVGIKSFVEALLQDYLALKHEKIPMSPPILQRNQPVSPEKTAEPYKGEPFEVDPFTPPEIIRDGYALPEIGTDMDNYRMDIHIPQAQLIAYLKKQKATPAIGIALLMSNAIKLQHPEADKPIVTSMAVDYRQALGVEETHRNAVGTAYLDFTNETAEISFAEQALCYRQKLNDQRETNFVRATVNQQMAMIKQVDNLTNLEERQEKLSFIGDLSINTFVLSYIGKMDFGKYNDKVKHVNLYSSGYKGLRINMVASSDTLTINLLANTSDPSLAKILLLELDKHAIPYTATDYQLFDTKKDKTRITAGRQAEKFFKKLEE